MANELILVVDDGKDNREFIIEYVLEPNGFRYMEGRDGAEGLDLALKNKPDLILLDLEMPRLKGTEVIENLAARGVDIPVILMTFHGSEEIAVEMYRLGVKDYIKKPYYPEEMLEAIERALSETRLRKEKEELMERVITSNRKLQRRVSELEILYEIGKNVTSIMAIEDLLPTIVTHAARITHAEEAKICLLERKKLVCRAILNQQMSQARFVQQEVRDRIAEHVMNNNQPVLLTPDNINGAGRDGRPVTLIYAPLIMNETVLGVISVYRYTPQASNFHPDDVRSLKVIGDFAAIAIENSRNFQALHHDRERVQDTFERFVPPSVVQRVLDKPDNLQLGGKRQEISILFADIRGYTSWSEDAEPEQVVEILNHYLSMAAGVILGWEGTLDKFFGDGLMAIFNAPDPQADHVHRATDAALALIKAAEEVNNLYGYRLSYSVGVNVGEAVVGYIGTDRALNYTAIGDTVNLAKRLQEYAQPGKILVDGNVVERLQGQITVKHLGDIQVKGRKTPASAFELIDLK